MAYRQCTNPACDAQVTQDRHRWGEPVVDHCVDFRGDQGGQYGVLAIGETRTCLDCQATEEVVIDSQLRL